MKKTLLLATSALVAVSAIAQNYSLTVTKTNGQTVTIPTSEITKMEFIDTGAEPDLPEAKGDLLDIVFKNDGTAVDISPMHNDVITNPGPTLMTYYSDIHKRNVANFRNPIGAATNSGYYRINYTAGGEFINKIADGCTMESIIMLGDTDPAGAEVKWFSSMQAGGIGFILPVHDSRNSGTITFLPNISTSGYSTWRWTYSQVVPEVGTYYHVVGVYNKSEAKTYIYINGKLSGTADTPGNYVPVASGAESFLLGGDPNTSQTTCESAWNGDIVTARIYSEPMTAEQVAALWEDAKFEQPEQSIKISNLRYLQECEVGEGFRYTFLADGLENGDVIELQENIKGTKLTPAATCDGSKMTFTIPAGMQSGTYRVIIKRGENVAPLFTVTFNVSATAAEPVAPKVIAHRGAHTDGATENSIAALTKAMKANYYGIELDIWITTDGVIVVHHDGVVNGVRFENSTYNQIKDIKLANGENLPTFESFLNTFKSLMNESDSKLIVEIKTHSSASRLNACVDKTLEMIEAAGLKDRTEYIAFSYDACKRIVSKDPAAMVGYLSGNLEPATVLKDGIRSIDYSYSAYNSNPTWIKKARELGMTVNVWTVNNEVEMLKYTGLGAHYITTDAPAVLTELNKIKFIEK